MMQAFHFDILTPTPTQNHMPPTENEDRRANLCSLRNILIDS